MRIFVLAAALLLSAWPARTAGFPQVSGDDALSREIRSMMTRPNAGVSAVVRVRSGQVVALAAPAQSPAAAIKPAPGLTRKPASKSSPRRKSAEEQLRRAARSKAWAERR